MNSRDTLLFIVVFLAGAVTLVARAFEARGAPS
jgi:hypothetical protein